MSSYGFSLGFLAILLTVVSFQNSPKASTTTTFNKRGRCPAPSGKVSICIFDPKRNCLMDSHCPGQKKCCREGCGKECKEPCRYRKCWRRCRKYALDKRGCQTCRCERRRCPPGKNQVRCLVNPCRVIKCPAYPKARCVPDYCGGCQAKFYFKGRRVCVNKKEQTAY